MMNMKSFLQFVRCLIGIALLTCLPLQYAAAITVTTPVPPSNDPTNTCTNSDLFDPNTSNSPGIVGTITEQVKTTTTDMAHDLFDTIAKSDTYTTALGGLLTLYIAIYGIFFAFGMAKESVYEFTVRMIKFSVVIVLATDAGSAWQLFFDNVVTLFTTWVDETINAVTSVAIGGATGIQPGAPLGVLDSAINKAFSAKMIVHLFAIATTGMYGFLHAVLAGLALMSLAGSFLLAIWIYLMSMVMRTLLFGLAPIFLAFLLFERTKPIFLGWINQIVSVCLQPIFLFTFLSFFLVLISSAMDSLLTTPVCWTQINDTVRATPFQYFFPRFAIPDPNNPTNWLQYQGDWLFQGADPGLGGPQSSISIFPVDILAILTFYILTQLAGRFSEVAVMVARDIASGASDLLKMQSGIQDFFTPTNKPSSGTSKVADRVGPPTLNNPTGSKEPITNEKVLATTRQAQNLQRDLIGGLKKLQDKLKPPPPPPPPKA
jgi:type IV secretory pathway VirB6-like protein